MLLQRVSNAGCEVARGAVARNGTHGKRTSVTEPLIIRGTSQDQTGADPWSDGSELRWDGLQTMAYGRAGQAFVHGARLRSTLEPAARVNANITMRHVLSCEDPVSCVCRGPTVLTSASDTSRPATQIAPKDRRPGPSTVKPDPAVPHRIRRDTGRSPAGVSVTWSVCHATVRFTGSSVR